MRAQRTRVGHDAFRPRLSECATGGGEGEGEGEGEGGGGGAAAAPPPLLLSLLCARLEACGALTRRRRQQQGEGEGEGEGELYTSGCGDAATVWWVQEALVRGEEPARILHTVRDVHALGQLLRAWLRELPEAVLPPSSWAGLAALLRRLQVPSSRQKYIPRQPQS
eukprot:SAG25_NODE_2297_length_1743_cov_1.347932_3_plen_166_part_00